ncbi:MAG: hypothetical protein AAF960_19945, partial [Bacteroidota bacterium]
YRVVNNHEKVVEVCQQALHYFESNSNVRSSSSIAVFCIEIIISCISLKNFDLGEKIYRKSVEFTQVGSINWFLTLDGYVLLCFHTKRYEDVYQILHLATSNKKYKLLPVQYQEIWKVYDAYINFLIEAEQLTIDKRENIKNFRVGKFLNEVPQYSKDKLGINISILIIHILFLLYRKKRDAIVERVDALTQYSYRYLIKDETYRSNCFIKMLAKMVKASFHKNATKRTTKKLYERLASTPLATKGQSQHVEIIPYEDLWELVLQKLVNRAM